MRGHFNPASGTSAKLIFAVLFAVGISSAGNAQVIIADDGTSTQASPSIAQSRKILFSIPAQPLITALDAYNAQSGALLFYDSHLVQGIQSSEVTGNLNAQDALVAMLKGTNLSPIKTSNGVITLMMNFKNISYADAPMVAAPLLTLEALKVSGPKGGDHRFYATSLAFAIRDALQRDAYLQHKNYRLDVNVWVTRSGEIENFQFIEPIDNDTMNHTISSILHQLTVDQAPADLDQPVHIKIHASGAS